MQYIGADIVTILFLWIFIRKREYNTFVINLSWFTMNKIEVLSLSFSLLRKCMTEKFAELKEKTTLHLFIKIFYNRPF